MLKVLMVASEATPFAKTGGLADVLGALPQALRSLGHEVAVLLPRYGFIDLTATTRIYDQLPIWLGSTRYNTSLYLMERDVPFYFVDCPPLYGRKELYGSGGNDFPDNHIRFALLSRAAVELCRHTFRPHIVHCHDWQAGLVATYLRTTQVADPAFAGLKTLFTIHNLGYQGLFGKHILADIGLDWSVFHLNGLEYMDMVSLIKGGLNYSDFLNTVSPTYAREIQTPEFGFGLDGVLRARSNVLTGILNGVDYGEWSPESDPFIAARYSASDLRGKRACKKDLLREFGLPPAVMERPLLGVVSRLDAQQKGLHLFADIVDQLAREDVCIVLLGTGDPFLEDRFRRAAAIHPRKIGVKIAFNNALAHKIEAGADMFVMPSRYEPCGLNQIYSLRYGAVPVVHATGGLDDTIDEGTGFKFWTYHSEALLAAIRRTCEAFADHARWGEIVRRGMAKDFSWEASAVAYAALYRRLIGQT